MFTTRTQKIKELLPYRIPSSKDGESALQLQCRIFASIESFTGQLRPVMLNDG